MKKISAWTQILPWLKILAMIWAVEQLETGLEHFTRPKGLPKKLHKHYQISTQGVM